MINSNQLAALLNQYVLSVTHIGLLRCDPAYGMDPFIQQYHSLHFIIKGSGTYIMNGSVHTVEAGKVFAFVPGTMFEWTSDADQPLEFYYIRFDYATAYKGPEGWYLAPSAADTRFPLFGMYTLLNTEGVYNLFKGIYAHSQKINDINSLLQKNLLHSLMCAIAEDLYTQQKTDNMDKLDATIEYMANHYKEELSMDKLAAMAGFSTSHYRKLFKQMTGYSPKDYLIRLRINHAKELLEFSGKHLNEIARKVGYQDEFYFSRIFKKTIGVSPSEYAKKPIGIKLE